ncbi:DICT sensory domain-containing protein [Dendronalium sp. ChiSLP03b]|uniref:DICT sensory domain-containing protein n=1 Tax=Dendronalium sp. ChiSLP03b TaxID=3075381 RepID=UPI002AD26F86|nr:DICT sensory domain-containing protein [Dendronalium sp. ChiSLP03b]MDZ8205281.1 DICT sensory domain-containing protein [Dendronalium sp. ChiSLP03b]
MNDSPRKDLSFYRLALGVEAPPQPLPLNPATLLSLVRSQIDLLIEQQIAATVWVKLPPGKIWHAELVRYQSSVSDASIYTCQIGEREKGTGEQKEKLLGGKPSKQTSGSRGELVTNLSSHPSIPSSANHLSVQLLPYRHLQREYFLIVLSPQFCSLILVYRPLKRGKTRVLAKENAVQAPPLLAMTTMESRVIQRVLDGMKVAIAPASSSIAVADITYPIASEPALVSQLLTKQLQRQDEMNRQNRSERIAKIQQQNQKLHNKEQLKDKYLRNMCQELRTPLTQMKTALSLLNSPTLKPPQRQRYLQMLNTQCDRQSTLITGLLDLVDLEQNLEKTTLELVRLSDIVPGVVSTYQPVAQEKGIMLAYTVPTELPAVWCVTGGLKQIVINLLHNSIKFTANGGRVWVRARVHGDYVQLEFRDTGIGIAESEIPKIFDCFYRVRSGLTEDLGGAGLGLTIVKRLLWRCGGSISVKSRPDEGSTFTLQLASRHDTPYPNLT